MHCLHSGIDTDSDASQRAQSSSEEEPARQPRNSKSSSFKEYFPVS